MNWLNAQQHESKGGAKWEVKVRWHSRYSDGCRIAWRIHRRVVFSDFSAEQLEQSYTWVAHQNPKYQPPWNAMLWTGGTTASCLPPWDLSAPRDAIAAHLCKMLSLYFSDASPYSGIMWTFCPLSTRRCIFSAAEYFEFSGCKCSLSLQDQLEPGSSILMHHKNLSSLVLNMSMAETTQVGLGRRGLAFSCLLSGHIVSACAKIGLWNKPCKDWDEGITRVAIASLHGFEPFKWRKWTMAHNGTMALKVWLVCW